ncbi:MAG: oligosaccharide flippase family protein [Defluviitaleaceae bacterium]|nr:oligosaccharide flippase family protein [Defluviitaleaceae bacterium]MCL2837381.1 oligosaccharide flippase family protein [Defluviitaleaceae bacterium]
MSKSKGKSMGNGIVRGALILTAAGLVTRVLGFAYRIFMSNTIGAEGMGLYQLIIPLYTLAWSISCAGITTTVSKLVASQNAKRHFGNMSLIVRIAMGMTLAMGLLVMCVMLLGADFIAVSLLKEPRTVMSIQILALAVPFMAVGSAARGYFTGLSQMHVPAISQVMEQVVRMAAISVAASTMLGRGLEYACAAAVIGIVAGEVVSFLYVLYTYRCHRLKWAFNSRVPDEGFKALLTSITAMSLPLTLNRVTGSLLAAVENVLIPRSLVGFGMSGGEAMASFGRISGMAMPLIFFPSAFLISLSTSIVPAVSEAAALKRLGSVEHVLSKSFLFTILVGIGAATVFLTLPRELGMAIYNQDIGEILFLLAFICPLWYYNITLSGVLNGLGAMGAVFRNNLISSAITITCIIIFVPRFGIAAFAAGWFAGICCQLILGTLRVKKEMALRLPLVHSVIKPAIAGAAAGLSVKLITGRLLFPVFGSLGGVIVSLLLITVLYMAFIVLLGVISHEELLKAYRRIIPQSKRIA